MNFGNLFGGREGRGGNDCCTWILILLLLTSCGCNFNICDLFSCDIIKILLLIYLLSCCGICGDGCGCRG